MASKHPKRVGMSCKNKKFKKRGLTPNEIRFIDKTMAEYKSWWAKMLALNKYEPHPKPRQ